MFRMFPKCFHYVNQIQFIMELSSNYIFCSYIQDIKWPPGQLDLEQAVRMNHLFNEQMEFNLVFLKGSALLRHQISKIY